MESRLPLASYSWIAERFILVAFFHSGQQRSNESNLGMCVRGEGIKTIRRIRFIVCLPFFSGEIAACWRE